jgi:hypothetical protein
MIITPDLSTITMIEPIALQNRGNSPFSCSYQLKFSLFIEDNMNIKHVDSLRLDARTML